MHVRGVDKNPYLWKRIEMNFRFPLASITITLKEWVKGMEELMFYLGNKQNILLNMEKNYIKVFNQWKNTLRKFCDQ